MRVSTYQQSRTMQDNITKATEKVTLLQTQLTSGKRLQQLSDDPVGASQFLSLRSASRTNDMYKTSISSATTMLQTAEGSLSEISALLNTAKQKAVNGANLQSDPAAMKALAVDVDNIITRFTQIVNDTKHNGQYLFSGKKTDAQPLTIAGDTAIYNGDTNSLQFDVSAGRSMQVTLSGDPIFTDIFNTLVTLQGNLENGNVSNISGVDLQMIQSSFDAVTQARGAIGSKVNELTTLKSQTERRSDQFSELMANIEEVDMVKVITDLKSAEVSYQAALEVTSRSFGLSLMDYIRGS